MVSSQFRPALGLPCGFKDMTFDKASKSTRTLLRSYIKCGHYIADDAKQALMYLDRIHAKLSKS